MITSLRLVNFKNFADETLRIGPFTVIVGANASGKSNIRDAFRFLHGIGRGYTLAEILGGKYGDGGYVEWTGIRGAPWEIVRLEKTYPNEWSMFTIHLELIVEEERIFKLTVEEERIHYSIKVGFHRTSGFIVLEESLSTESGPIYTTKAANDDNLCLLVGEARKELPGLSRLKPALCQISDHLRQNPAFTGIVIPRDELAILRVQVATISSRFLEPSPDRMRSPSFPGMPMLDDGGGNLPSVLESVCSDPDRKRVLMSWLQELTPMDVKDFDFPRDPSGRVHLQIVERNGRKVSAYSASDGTLRFLAMLAALLSPSRAGVYFFEDIDAGIHPARLWLLIDFIEKQTAMGDVQVITTTHSPALLTWINDKTFEHTSIVYRDENWADSIIRPISELHNLRELRKSDTLGELFTENWMENMLAFSEVKPDTDYLDDEDTEVQG